MMQKNPEFNQMVIAEYHQVYLPEHRGNPLIEAIPPFQTAEEILPTFGKFPIFNKNDRSWSRSARMLALSRLDNYLEPLTCHKDIIEQISLMIHAGYTNRNPATAQYRKALVEFYRQSIEGPVRPIQPSAPSTARALSLFGVSGVGKSSVVERMLSYLPQVIAHPKYGLEPQIVWLKLDCPLDGSLKQLLISFISQVDQILNTTYAELTKRPGVDELIVIVAKIAAKHHLGLFVVDEIQNLLEASGVGPAKMLNFFVTFVNIAKVPLIVLGTLKAQRFLRTLFREARRLSDSGSVVWDRMEQGDEWDFFLKELGKYQWTLKPVDISESHLSEVIYFHTQGVHALVVRLFQLSQLRAIRDGTECLTDSLIRQIALKQFTLLKPALEALQSRDPKRIAKYEDLISDGLEALNSQVVADDKLAALHEVKSGEKKVNSDRARLVTNLVKLGVRGKEAQHVVETLFSTDRITKAKREQIISKIAEGDLRNSDESLIELFKKAKSKGIDVGTALSSGGRKAKKRAAL